MVKNFSILLTPLLLSGCVGSFLLDGEGGYLESCFPDIRSVPSRATAYAPRTCSHKNNQEVLGNLEHARQEIQKHDKTLRKEFFPEKEK